MIYRIIGESERWKWVEDEQGEPDLVPVTGEMKGAFHADLSWFWFDGIDQLPAPSSVNRRARFWFTEAGWDKYGRQVLADAMRSGRTYRLLVKKNPPSSAVVYRDRWQVALLPVKR